MSPTVERLYDLMRERGLTARRVTSDLNMSSTAFTDWKNGKSDPGVSSLSKLAPYFGVTIDYLITGKDSSASRAEARERAFLEKLSLLPVSGPEKVSGYIDGILETLPANMEMCGNQASAQEKM